MMLTVHPATCSKRPGNVSGLWPVRPAEPLMRDLFNERSVGSSVQAALRRSLSVV